ncbi:hypothetical protein BCV69DRAFT_763 [Microstroma glucosiphilum]|uniref:Uncharacterized protein n=1 Tax=Pseudomicrostroma glucosiphilum TaxID=1684307 RepID=A0A316UE65_9BASI|nr:hypothetical protein BCV69DRAFT_763 [Pseudomicrostroma glucosiphilum]PWN23500.1 hypothetical protein BCV69DRAFT_763 [Pseudomicrostroma glucosiphilum]
MRLLDLLLLASLWAVFLQAGTAHRNLPLHSDDSHISLRMNNEADDSRRIFHLSVGTPASPRGDRATRDWHKSRQKLHRMNTFSYKTAVVDGVKKMVRCIGKCLTATILENERVLNPDGYEPLVGHF